MRDAPWTLWVVGFRLCMLGYQVSETTVLLYVLLVLWELGCLWTQMCAAGRSLLHVQLVGKLICKYEALMGNMGCFSFFFFCWCYCGHRALQRVQPFLSYKKRCTFPFECSGGWMFNYIKWIEVEIWNTLKDFSIFQLTPGLSVFLRLLAEAWLSTRNSLQVTINVAGIYSCLGTHSCEYNHANYFFLFGGVKVRNASVEISSKVQYHLWLLVGEC